MAWRATWPWQWALRELAAIAYFDLALLYDRKGNLLPPGKMPKDALRAIDIEIQFSFVFTRTSGPCGRLSPIPVLDGDLGAA